LNNRETTWALVPIKDFAAAKSRLSPALSAMQSAELAACMAADVLAALRGCARIERVACLGSGRAVRRLAAQYGCHLIAEPPGAGLSGGLNAAAREIERRGARTLLIVPGDLPMLTSEDVDALLDAHAGGLSICPARRDGGTNALVITPPTAIDFRFGDDSCARHVDAARAVGLDPQCIELAAFDDDIDTPADLERLTRMKPLGYTGRFLASPYRKVRTA
jgi:2-phospho-L-lactate guanylyltransferase